MTILQVTALMYSAFNSGFSDKLFNLFLIESAFDSMYMISNYMISGLPTLPIAAADWILGIVLLAKLLPLSELWLVAPSSKHFRL